MKKTLVLLLVLLGICSGGCAGRIPSNAKAASIAKKHFEKYGKKFKETEFSQSRVSAVEVKAVEELQKNLATSFLVVKFENGSEIPVIMTFQRKQPLGWRATGWEKASSTP